MAPIFFWRKLTKFWLLKGRSSEWKFQRSGNIIHFWFPFWNSICKYIFTMYLISRNRWLGEEETQPLNWTEFRFDAARTHSDIYIRLRSGGDPFFFQQPPDLSQQSPCPKSSSWSSLEYWMLPSPNPSPTATRGAYLLLNYTIAFGHASGRGWSIQFEQQCTTTASYPFVGDVANSCELFAS